MKEIKISPWLVAIATNTVQEQSNVLNAITRPLRIPLNASELALERVNAIEVLFRDKWWIDSHTITGSLHRAVNAVVRHNFREFFDSIPPIWRHRLTTSTAQFRYEDTMSYFDAKYIPRDNFLDHDVISDGWMRVRYPIQLQQEASWFVRMTMQAYLNTNGWWMTAVGLELNPIFRAIIPDSRLRKKYTTCLEILDNFSFAERGLHSLWRPWEMESGFLRYVSLGWKWEAVYPPNATTTSHKIICRTTWWREAKN